MRTRLAVLVVCVTLGLSVLQARQSQLNLVTSSPLDSYLESLRAQSGIPGMSAGFPKVEISFLVNADGILVVRAKELRSGVEQTIEVKPQYGLTDAQVEQMLLDSITHAKEDMQTRALLEAKTEATQVIASAEKFLVNNAAILSEQDAAGMRTQMQLLEESLKSGDKDLIHAKMDDLNEFTLPFAHRVMDAALSEAMKGRKI